MEKALIQKLPKVELHCHLDGSIDIETLVELTNNERSKSELLKEVVAPEVCYDLAQYLSCFPAVTRLLNNKQRMILAVLSVFKQAFAENVIYLELRYSPTYVATTNFSEEDSIQAVIEGIQFAKTYYPIEASLIICLMRGQNEATNQFILNLATKYYGKGVSGIDIAGNEAKYPTKLYQNLLEQVQKAQMNLTVHAGETGSIENVLTAVQLGAKRIGHGIALMNSQNDTHYVKNQNILLELCPVSNLQTRAAKNWQNYPFPYFIEQNLPISINTDNRTVSDTTLTNEFYQLDQHVLPLTVERIEQITLNSLQFAFTTDAIKEQLIKRMKTDYQLLQKTGY